MPTSTSRTSRSLTTRYLMTCAAIGAATGVLLVPANFVSAALASTVPVLYSAMVGLWIIGPVLALALVRRPGAAVLTMLVAGVISSASPLGASSILTCLMIGAALELVFLVTLYRVWSPWLFCTGTFVFAALYTWSAFVAFDAAAMATVVQVLIVVLMMGSALAGAWLGLLLARRLEKAGVARGLAPARTRTAAPVETAAAPSGTATAAESA
ncbi:ECF transporter S component [Cellulosimicrobium arenosum]|uniref:ECF transporter S component n=1 Tax=Cellulosimicrobium arenosum TaxID=2708133 RepID=A0A927PEN9_9MICO|nr:ECF transporter S component [Cellulosimicrobium arenosum]MBD8079697.1 ECF transporter S component [Cellulosimicrobium arenosum]